MRQLSNRALWQKCAEWGSYIRAGDPGACMYGFNETSGFQDVEHARDVMQWSRECFDFAASYVNNGQGRVFGYTKRDLVDLSNIIHTARAYCEDRGLII